MLEPSRCLLQLLEKACQEVRKSLLDLGVGNKFILGEHFEKNHFCQNLDLFLQFSCLKWLYFKAKILHIKVNSFKVELIWPRKPTPTHKVALL